MYPDLFDLTGTTALITGGTRGIGAAIAIALAEAGADIVLVQKNFSTQHQKIAVEKLNRKCFTYSCELGNKDDVSNLIPTVTADHKIDILVNFAGILERHPAADFPLSAYDEILQVNLTSTFILSQEIGKYWIGNGMKGKIINAASLTAFLGSVNLVAYGMSKAGIAQMTKAMSNEWAAKGINVNAIAPGYVSTDMNVDTRTGDPAYLKSLTDRIPMGRWGTPDDFKGPGLFLASKASDYVTGQILTIDGGYMGR